MPRYLMPSLLALLLAPAALGGSFEVTVRAVDEGGKPVPKAEASLFWEVVDGKMTARKGGNYVTDADGKVTIRIDDWNEKRPVMALTENRSLGGTAGVSAADAGKVVTLAMGPTVKVKGKLEIDGLGRAPTWANTWLRVEGLRAPFIQNVSKDGTFAFTLPAGKYHFESYGQDVLRAKKDHVFTAERSEYDLGTVAIPPTPLLKLVGKPCPKWEYVDGRGLKAGVQAADFKGKWVLLEFWGHWCGPCVAGAIPELIGLDADHAAHRDQYAIVTVHCRGPNTFPEIDKRLPAIEGGCWGGRKLPFPVLIDADEKGMAAAFGVTGFPSGVLIDPAGNVVGEAEAKDLEAKLPKLPAATLWARHRDMRRNIGWSYNAMRPLTPRGFAETLTGLIGTPVLLDEAAAKAAGLTPDGPLPSVVYGYPMTLRSIEELLLAPHGLGVAVDADGKGLRVTKTAPAAAPPTPLQAWQAKELNAALDRKPKPGEKTATLDLKGVPLREAAKRIAAEFDIAVALDAAAIHAKKLDPDAKLSGRLDGGSLRATLAEALKPLGLTFEVRSEAIVIGPTK